MKDLLRRLLNWLTPSGSVLQRSVKSGVWVSVMNISLRFTQVLMLIILARLLPPEAFGLVGIALLTVSAMRRFTKIGLNAALIRQKEKNVDEYLDTTWSLEAGRALLIFGILFLAAPYIAQFFSEPEATSIIRVLALGPVLKGIQNPGIVYFRKDLEYHKEFIYKSSGGVTQLIVGVGYALISPTVWALVAASVARPAVQTGLSYVLHGYRPWPALKIDAAKELINYGKWITGANIVQFLSSEGDDAFVGWFLSATALGFYQYAYRLADLPPREVSGVVAEITFPAYSQLQDNMEELQSALVQTTRMLSFVVFPMAFGVVLVAPSFVPVVLGDEWTPMITTLQILAMYGLMHGITRHVGSVWKTLDRPDFMVYAGLIRISLMAIFILPATARWGINGTALVVTGIYIFPMLPIDIYITARLTEMRSIRLYKEYLYPFIAALTMFGTLWYARTLVDVPPIVELVVLIPAGAVVYIAVSALLEWQFDWGVEEIVRTVAKGMK
ncbi:lipopolysaccharide biosynthesis protein [Halobacteriaceae archaeon SHR40]|uniref:lipopolysaccharide biosynthesis protein n=1 Tax=Halovenus amylolytica TaxID=2500550 RepID=UPI000FE3B0C6